MKIKINETTVSVKFVDYLDNDFIGLFDSAQDVIKILASSEQKRGILIHELTYAYMFYYGFANAPLNAELVSNFMEIYAEKILNQVDKILNYNELN